MMRKRTVTMPEMMLIVGTRIVLGAGLGLLIGDRVNSDSRRGAGWALFAVGALSTIPLVMGLMCKPDASEQERA